MREPVRDDRILPVTRGVAAAVIPFLVLAFLILWFFPQLSGERFAWKIQPELMAVYMGAGYLGGAYLFLQTAIGRKWHRVAAGFPAVSVFTAAMLLATVLHREKFSLAHFPAQLWMLLYVITPFLIPWLWWRNRVTDSGAPEPRDAVVPARVRLAVRALGLGLLVVAVAGFIAPSLLMRFWPWPLTPLTGRVLAGWGLLLAVGNLMIAREARWSAWRVGVGSIALWHVLFLAGAALYPQGFTFGRWLNWFTVSVLLVLAGVAALYVVMERQRSSAAPE